MSPFTQNKSGLISFLKTIAAFRGDLSTLPAPPFLLATVSTLEFATFCAEQPSVFIAPALEPDPCQRALLVLKWYFSWLKWQDVGRMAKLGGKKPLNPFLGEVFLGTWEGEEGLTEMICEQVSHHPAVSAFCIRNEKHGVRLEGFASQRMSFNGTLSVIQYGHAKLHLSNYDEDYIITFPPFRIKGLVAGSPYIELEGEAFIYGSNGYVSQVKYEANGWLSRKKNSCTATLSEPGLEGKAIFEAKGQWSEDVVFQDLRTSRPVEGLSTDTHASVPLTVRPLSEQDPWESRKAWAGVVEAIGANDMLGTGLEKAKIENGQRRMRETEKAQARTWDPLFFRRVENDDVAERIEMKDKIEEEKTGGVWRWDKEKTGLVARPFHGDLQPTG